MATTHGMVRKALGDLDARLDHWRQTLVALCRIPSVSAAGFPLKMCAAPRRRWRRPGMDAREAGRLIVKKLSTKPPYGVKVTASVTGTTPWWTTDPE
jgi:hypothetical protein